MKYLNLVGFKKTKRYQMAIKCKIKIGLAALTLGFSLSVLSDLFQR